MIFVTLWLIFVEALRDLLRVTERHGHDRPRLLSAHASEQETCSYTPLAMITLAWPLRVTLRRQVGSGVS